MHVVIEIIENKDTITLIDKIFEMNEKWSQRMLDLIE
jgi:hypothetical protein